MRNIFIASLIICYGFQAFSQKDSLRLNSNRTNDKTEYLFKTTKLKTIGLYFAPEIGIGALNSTTAPIVGGSTMLLFNKKFGLGIAGQITANPKNSSEMLKLGYGGVKLEYTIRPNKKIHATIPLLIGGAYAHNDSLPYTNYRHTGNKSRNYDQERHQHTGSQFFIIQPGVNIEANLMKYLKIFGGINYRLATKTNNGRNTNSGDTISAKQISGITATIGIKIGLFDYNISKKDSTYKRKKYHKNSN